MPALPTKSPEQAMAEFNKLSAIYDASPMATTFNALIYGEVGTGKTQILSTARPPILIHSFDPGGTKTIRHLIRSAANPTGSIVVDDRFENEDSRTPTAYELWKKEASRLEREGIFSVIGTYVIDSATMWGEAIMNQTMKEQKNTTTVPSQREYQLQMTAIKQAVKDLCGLPCDFILTGHVDIKKDEITGRIKSGPMLTGKLQESLPALFDEVWVTSAQGSGEKITYSVLTCNDGYWKARTRLGSNGLLQPKEVPNICAILQKVGLMPKP